MAFVNREKELAALEDFRSRPGFQFLPVYGRRRVGKTTLLREFLKRRGGIYYLCRQVAETEQLRSLGRVLGEAFGDSFVAQRGFGDWDQFFDYVAERAKKTEEKTVLVIDEYPYLLSSCPGISSRFQQAIDERWSDTGLFVILCGSQMAMMEREVLGYKAPLYGRRTGQLKVAPFDYRESVGFFPGRSIRTRMAFWAVCGGIPAYLNKLSPQGSVRANIIKNFGCDEEFLCQEPEFLLRQELHEVRYYFSIVQAVARGHRKLGLLVNETGLDKALVGKYLKVLSDLHIVDREVPVLEERPERSRRGLYRVRDNLFDFYFRFIFPNKHLLRVEDGRALYDRSIAPSFDQFVALRAEDAACELVRQEFPHLVRVGRQWDRSRELDIVGVDADGRVGLIGEVKWWKGKPVGVNVLNGLRSKAEAMGIEAKNIPTILFSASGFTRELEDQDVLLRDFSVDVSALPARSTTKAETTDRPPDGPTCGTRRI